MEKGQIVRIHGQVTQVTEVHPGIVITMVEVDPPVVVPDIRYTATKFDTAQVYTNCLACGSAFSVHYDHDSGFRICDVCGAI